MTINAETLKDILNTIIADETKKFDDIKEEELEEIVKCFRSEISDLIDNEFHSLEQLKDDE